MLNLKTVLNRKIRTGPLFSKETQPATSIQQLRQKPQQQQRQEFHFLESCFRITIRVSSPINVAIVELIVQPDIGGHDPSYDDENDHQTSSSIQSINGTSLEENEDKSASRTVEMAPLNYELIVDYRFIVGESGAPKEADGNEDNSCAIGAYPDDSHFSVDDNNLNEEYAKFLMERDKWSSRREVLHTVSLPPDIPEFLIDFALNVREVLSPQDLAERTSYRNFYVLTNNRHFYVNTAQLKQLGGAIFRDWYDRECQGEDRCVVQSLSSEELATLLESCCAYSSGPVIHRRNMDDLLAIAEKERIGGLLRAIESHLISARMVNPIRKLEYAAEFRMACLAQTVLRQFPSKLARLDALFEYVSENGESLDDMHCDVLEMLDVHTDYVVL